MTAGDRAVYLGYRAGSLVARALPKPVASAAARGASRVMLRTMRDRRTVVGRHMRRVHGDTLGPRAVNRLVRKAFDSYARYWMESFRLPGTTTAELEATMSWSGLEHLDAALAKGQGAVLALPHLGGWDATGAWFATLGNPVSVVVEPVRPPELFEWFATLRRGYGVNVVPIGPQAGTALLRALHANEIVGLVCDRDILGSGVEVEFFGERTTLPSGPATLALRTGAALLPAGMYFEGRYGHLGVMRPAVPVHREGRLREDVARVTQSLASELEALIRRAPEQWHLFQPNWPSDFDALGRARVRPGASADAQDAVTSPLV